MNQKEKAKKPLNKLKDIKYCQKKNTFFIIFQTIILVIMCSYFDLAYFTTLPCFFSLPTFICKSTTFTRFQVETILNYLNL